MTRVLPALLLALALLHPAAATAAAATAFAPDGAGPLYPASADGREHQRPQLTAARLHVGETVKLDGRLDDPIWARAEAGFGFQQHDPERFGQASVPTVFKVAYDDQAIYIAAACWEHDMDLVARRLSRRDSIESSDLLSIYLDPYHDRLTGYNFRITADGVKVDSYMFDDGNRDTDWDAVWEAETTEDHRGWYAEVRIPLRALRFRPAPSMTWGLQVYRWLHGRGEDTGWATWDRDDSGFVSRWGTLVGLDDIASTRTLEVLPYVAGGLTDEPQPGHDPLTRYLNLGADLKYNVSGALTAQATFQPDFGQVEADPALLNLSPFETRYQEKRPFFVEGARFFTHPSFNLFYSRRIGTGLEGSRIRAAGKLTGKLGGRTTVAALAAFTDVTSPERIHNPLRSGDREAGYAVVRLARDLDDGNHSVGVMGTGVWRQRDDHVDPNDPRRHRDAFSGGVDWEFNLLDKAWGIDGSVVGTVVDPHPVVADPTLPHDAIHGTAGALNLRKQSGSFRGALEGSWESDRFDPNDLGFQTTNDKITSQAWIQYRYDADGEDTFFKSSYHYLQAYKGWFYAEQARQDDAGDDIWRHGRGHRQYTNFWYEGTSQTHGYREVRLTAYHSLPGTSKYLTRQFEGQPGPLMTTSPETSLDINVQSDWRGDVVHGVGVSGFRDEAGSRHLAGSYSLRWNVNRHLIARLSTSYRDQRVDAQWLVNRADPEVGLGGVSYVFGRLDQRILDATLRASWLPSRDASFDLYVQPYLTTGRHTDPRYLARPDSRDLRPYDLDASLYDFTYAALNLNLVYRWEYRPGSTIYVVWTHGRTSDNKRRLLGDPEAFDTAMRPGLLFDQEPRNTVLVKMNYWFSI